MTLKDIVEYIRDAIAITYEDNSIPVFTKKSITDMYNNRLIHYGFWYDSIDEVAFAQNTHVTRVRQEIHEKILGLCVAKKGREVTFTIYDEVGRVLYAAFTWSSEEHDCVFSKTARAIRVRLFEKEEFFDGDASLERQVQSVPDILIKFISIILEGGNFNWSLSTSQHKISPNIAQLIRSNSAKRKRSEKTQNFCHSTKNESPLSVLLGLKVHIKTGKSSLVDSLADEGMSLTYNQVFEICRIVLNQVCVEYQERAWPQLQDHVFSTAAIDNLDQNLTYAIVQSLFHGTLISIFQHSAVPIFSPPFWLNTTKADKIDAQNYHFQNLSLKIDQYQKLNQIPHNIPV